MRSLEMRAAMRISAVVVWVCSMSAAEASAPAADKLRVVCTTTMITDLVQTIAGDAADVRGIMRPGEDPHVYDVRPRDVQLVADAQLVVMNGLHLEATLGAVIEHNTPDATVVKLAETPEITPLASEQTKGAPDPHCWFNVQYFRIYAQRARDALIAADAANGDAYRDRAAIYIKQLDELDAWVRSEIASVPVERRVMVTSHDAFQYFCKAYQIDVYAVIGISTEQQAKPRDLVRLEAIVRERGVKALFVETSVSNTLNSLVKKVAARSGASIGGTLYSDSLGPPDTSAGTYIGMVRRNTKTVVEALR